MSDSLDRLPVVVDPMLGYDQTQEYDCEQHMSGRRRSGMPHTFGVSWYKPLLTAELVHNAGEEVIFIRRATEEEAAQAIGCDEWEVEGDYPNDA